MDTAAGAARLERLRSLRGSRVVDASLGRDVAALGRALARARRSDAGVAEAWEAVCPPALAARTALGGLSRGVLTVRTPDASTRFEVDRFLREGGERSLTGASRAAVRRVKVVVGAV